MTAEDVLDIVRLRLNDADGTRYLSADLLQALCDGMRELFSLRPDCTILEADTEIHIEPPVDVTAESDELTVHERFRPALVDYVLWQAYSRDSDEHEVNAAGKAAFHRDSFARRAAAL